MKQSSLAPAAFVSGELTPDQAVRPLGVADMFRAGIGPSSSHTVGPMRAAYHFASELGENFAVGPIKITRVEAQLTGSLGATGKGHATDRAVLLGLSGYLPQTVPLQVVESLMDEVARSRSLTIPKLGAIAFDYRRDMVFLPRTILPYHVNGLVLRAFCATGEVQYARTYYSVGGGFVMIEEEGSDPHKPVMRDLADPHHSANPDDHRDAPVVALTSDRAHLAHQSPAPYPYTTALELCELCERHNLSISQLVRANEESTRTRAEVDAYIDSIIAAMDECIDNGCRTEGILPGGLQVWRRAPQLYRKLQAGVQQQQDNLSDGAAPPPDPMAGVDWVNLYALAVNEENAAGHRVVTAPTNGAAGVVPAVLRYYRDFVPGATREGARNFLLAATAIGGLIKTNASIAGAEVGCQGEVGSASAMAAAGLAEAMGGTVWQVENAGEIAMEHSLGLTCDPVGGLVQIPCIERNAIGAMKAINAARMALWGDGTHQVSFDTVIETMRQTGRDMMSKYKETSEGGLAVNVVEC